MDCTIAHPVYMSILLCSMQPVDARSASISYGNSSFLVHVETGVKSCRTSEERKTRGIEKGKAEFSRISRTESRTCLAANKASERTESDVKIQRGKYRWRTHLTLRL